MKRDFKKGENKQQNGYDKLSKSKVKFDDNYNFYGIYGYREYDCYKKKKEKGGKGFKKSNNFNEKKNKMNSTYVYAFYSKSLYFSNDWIVDFGCTNHMYFEKVKFENFHKYRKYAIVMDDNSVLEFEGIGSVLL